MKVFISWSGARSRHAAFALRGFLPCVVQAVKPFASSDDIAKGEFWFARIEAEVRESEFGVVCVTPENQGSPFLNFETGALVKQLGSTRVCPYLVGLTDSELNQPLALLQSAQANREDTLKLLLSMNDVLRDDALDEGVLNKTFDRFWNDFGAELGRIPSVPIIQRERSDREVLVEILGILRTNERRLATTGGTRRVIDDPRRVIDDPRTLPVGSADPVGLLERMMEDGPSCDSCGHLTVRNGSSYKCLNCGNSVGVA